jgi:hypothetical protein
MDGHILEHSLGINRDRDGNPDHFVNGIGNGQYHDPATGNTGNIGDLTLQEGRQTRGLNFNSEGR